MDDLTKSILLTPFNILYKINPVLETKLLYRLKMGEKLDLEHPRTFNQKLQWIKLYDKNQLKTVCCDKYTVREYVESKGLSHILNELYWEGFDPEMIPFDDLPERFVIKVTHGSTFNIICKDKAKLDREKTVIQLKKWLKAKFIPCYGEWWYGVVKPRVIVERFLEDPEYNELIDYKIMCFNGEPKLIDVHTERFNGHKRNFYDLDWNYLEGYKLKFDNGKLIPKPKVLDRVLEYASILSKDFIHARVDFYIIGTDVYFGELTFANGAGFDKLSPREFDLQMGEWLKLPSNKN